MTVAAGLCPSSGNSNFKPPPGTTITSTNTNTSRGTALTGSQHVQGCPMAGSGNLRRASGAGTHQRADGSAGQEERCNERCLEVRHSQQMQVECAEHQRIPRRAAHNALRAGGLGLGPLPSSCRHRVLSTQSTGCMPTQANAR